jgi:hypothetical protein
VTRGSLADYERRRSFDKPAAATLGYRQARSFTANALRLSPPHERAQLERVGVTCLAGPFF